MQAYFCRCVANKDLIWFFAHDTLKMAAAKPNPCFPGIRSDPHRCLTKYIIFHPFNPNCAGHLSGTPRVPEPVRDSAQEAGGGGKGNSKDWEPLEADGEDKSWDPVEASSEDESPLEVGSEDEAWDPVDASGEDEGWDSVEAGSEDEGWDTVEAVGEDEGPLKAVGEGNSWDPQDASNTQGHGFKIKQEIKHIKKTLNYNNVLSQSKPTFKKMPSHVVNIFFSYYLNLTLCLCHKCPNLPVLFISLLHYTIKEKGWSSVFVPPPSTSILPPLLLNW